MVFLRGVSLAMFVLMVTYTSVTIANHGWDLLPVFFGDMLAMGWPGQFNFDFTGFLVLSGLWVLWRHDFSPLGIALAPVAVFGGILFLSAYLFVLSSYVARSVPELLLGRRRLEALTAAPDAAQ